MNSPDILIAAPSAMELEPVMSRFHGHNPRGLVVGVGPGSTAHRLTRAIAEQRPDVVILVGIAGAFTGSSLNLKDICIASSETYGDLGRCTGLTMERIILPDQDGITMEFRALNFRKLDEHQRWLVLASCAVFFLFTLSGSRRSYYIMPLIPFLALSVAAFILRPANARIRSLALSGQALVLFIAGLVQLVSPLLWPLIKAQTGFAAPVSLKVSTAVTGGLALAVLGAGRLGLMRKSVSDGSLRRAIAMLLSAVVLLGGFFCFQQSSLEAYRTRKPFILKLKRLIPGIPPEMIGISKNMAGVVFYLDMPRPVVDVEKEENLMKFLDQQGEKVIVARKKDARKILPHLAEGSFRKILSAPEFAWSRRNNKGLVAWKIY